jgi:hypothetical protein
MGREARLHCGVDIATIFLSQKGFIEKVSALFPNDEGDFTASFNPELDRCWLCGLCLAVILAGP